MCGIIGICGQGTIASELYDRLSAIQHHGQDAVGIATYDERFHLEKGLGPVMDVFLEGLAQFRGKIGLSHVRYLNVDAGTADDAPIHCQFSIGRLQWSTMET